MLNEVLDHLPTSLPRLRRIAEKCEKNDRAFSTITDIHLAVERRNSAQIYYLIIAFIAVMVVLLADPQIKPHLIRTRNYPAK